MCLCSAIAQLLHRYTILARANAQPSTYVDLYVARKCELVTMRLINAQTLQLEDFTLREVPPYAILSHTWRDEEVTFQDMLSGRADLTSRRGYIKIIETCRLASAQGLGYVWVDTCCIDKSSSAELTESINSMFRYYAESRLCIAYLDDLYNGMSNDTLTTCRWFTRGWTLQELIAPRVMGFYNHSWNCIGTRANLIGDISSGTMIPEAALSQPWDPNSFSIAERMSWASNRQTTREEDIAYCLLGLFDVNMSLIYGEGSRAFQRLQEEILKRDTDMTIFAWSAPLDQGPSDPSTQGVRLIAPSPSAFSHSTGLMPLVVHYPEFSVTNKGLLVAPDTPLRIAPSSQEVFNGPVYIYLCRKQEVQGLSVTVVILPLRKLGPKLFCRHKDLSLIEYDMQQATRDFRCLQNTSSYHIITSSLTTRLSNFRPFRQYAIHVPQTQSFVLTHVVPEYLWDPEDRMFLRPNPALGGFFPMVIALKFQFRDARGHLPIMVVCDNSTGIPSVGMVPKEHVMASGSILFRESCREYSVLWPEFWRLGIEVNWSDQAAIQVEESGHDIVLAGSLDVPMVRIENHFKSRQKWAALLPMPL